MAKRKTVEIKTLKDRANRYLASKDLTPDARKAIAGFLTGVLLSTDNYEGFNYLDWVEGGSDQWRADGSPEDNTKYLGDLTRVVFY